MVSDQIAARGVKDPAVLAALRKIERHRFVPPSYLPEAYADHPLPIGYGQTISQPYIVGLMSEALGVKPGIGCSRSAPGAATRRLSWPSWAWRSTR